MIADIAPLPPGEAARQAGSANELEGAMQSATISGVGGGAIGAAAGAVAGAAGSGGGYRAQAPNELFFTYLKASGSFAVDSNTATCKGDRPSVLAGLAAVTIRDRTARSGNPTI